jgi:hypothetical protein
LLLLSYVYNEPIFLDGYLDKLKHKVSFFGSWNRRYFRVNSKTATLEYFSDKAHAEANIEPSGRILLIDITAIRQFDEFSFHLDAGKSGTYLLKTSSNADLISWMREFSNYIIDRQEYLRKIIVARTM